MKDTVKFWRSSLIVVLVGMALILLTPGAFASPTYGQGSNAWWQWALSIPTSTNPLLGDYSGDPKCSAGQSGSVWFLAGTFGGGSATRSCTIPADKTLFSPTINFFQNNVGVNSNKNCPPTNFTVEQMWGILDKNVKDVTTHEATVDGVSQQDHRAGPKNTPYSVTIPKDNLFTYACGNPPIPAGTYYPNVSDGYYVMLAPLSKGTHTIHFSAATSQSTQDVTYHLTVQ